MIEKCQVFTPTDVVVQMLDLIGYKKNIFGKRIIENACGDGNILTVVVDRYIKDCLEKRISKSKIKAGLERDIFGVEIDKEHYKNCMLNLDEIAKGYDIVNVKWNILNVDFLKKEFSFKFDFVVGNPPYISYRDLDIETRSFVREKYEVCKKGKFDYCYAFIEASIKILSEEGKLSYLIPNSIFKNVFANDLRIFLLPFLNELHDYKTVKLFNVLTSSAIIISDKANKVSKIKYVNLDENVSYLIEKQKLFEKWKFSNKKIIIEKAKFGDFFSAASSIATLLNKAFVLGQKKSHQEMIDDSNPDRIEKKIIREAASPRSLGSNKKEFIIFPYFYNDDFLKRYKIEEFELKFPNGTAYLKRFHEELKKRAADKSVKWFEYGRTQALAHLNQEKLLVSTVITNKIKVYKLEQDVIPYSGIYITKKSDLDLNLARKILESDEFLEYAKNIGINANGSSLRITVKDINNYTFNIGEA